MEESSLEELEKEVAKSYNRVAQGYNAPSHKTVRNFEVMTLAFLRENLFTEVKSGQLVLDLGGGRGYVARRLSKTGCRVFIGDISVGMLRCAIQDSGGKVMSYIQLSAFKLPFKDNTFDVVLTLLCGAYLRREAVVEIRRVLKHKGIYIGTETPKEWVIASQQQRDMPSNKTWFKDHEGSVVLLPFRYVYSLKELTSLLEEYGLQVVAKNTLRPEDLIPPENISTVNRNVAKILGLSVHEIPVLSAWIACKP